MKRLIYYSITVNGTISVYNWYYAIQKIPKEKGDRNVIIKIGNLEKNYLQMGPTKIMKKQKKGNKKTEITNSL